MGAQCGNPITSSFNHSKAEQGRMDAFEYFLYLEVLTLYNFNSYLTCSCFLCLSFLQCCIKKHSGNARVTVAAVGRTCFFSHESFNRSLENLKMKLLHLSGQIWLFVSFLPLLKFKNHYFCMQGKMLFIGTSQCMLA